MADDEPSGVFLDHVTIDRIKDIAGDDRHQRTKDRKTGLTFDPSSYLAANSLRQSCSEAFSLFPASKPSPPDRGNTFEHDSNTIHLPARDPSRSIIYDNQTDLLHLRFGPALPYDLGTFDPNGSADEDYAPRVFKSSLSDILLYPWTPEMSSTLRNARRIAIDLADLELALPLSLLRAVAPQALGQEVACLVEWFQLGLEAFQGQQEKPGGSLAQKLEMSTSMSTEPAKTDSER
ncbi:uncharacterized protein BDV17DRAFT_290097 [Aspergillus undulatus]|uniref:uncharacterized protein n=1 Tax=Aspergillus undulatus TaxID=1810928 RepID=UPI003CCD344B